MPDLPLPRIEMLKQMTLEGSDEVQAAAAHGVTAPRLGRYPTGGEGALADASFRPRPPPKSIGASEALVIFERRKRRMQQARAARSVGVSAASSIAFRRERACSS